jgi:hypothetical protein
MVGATEACDHSGIHPVVFGALRFAVGIALDLERVRYADGMAGLMKKEGQGLSVGGGGLQADMQCRERVTLDPLLKLSEALRGVRELAPVGLGFFGLSGRRIRTRKPRSKPLQRCL